MRKIVLTGAAGGIGRDVALFFANSGAHVIACDNDAVGLRSLFEETTRLGGSIKTIVFDLCHLDSIRLVEDEVSRYESIDALVNCAGICSNTAIDTISPEEWDRTYAINVKGSFFLTQRLIPYLKKGNSPSIVNVSSMAGFTGSILSSPAYSSSKAAVTCNTKNFARYCAQFGIRVNEVSPGTALTQMTINAFGEESIPGFISKIPLGRLANPRDITSTISFLVSEDASFITGQSIQVNGGMYIP